VSKGAVFVALSRFYIDGALYQYNSLNTALVFLAIASMLVGNWLALRQENIKRLLAYSSIAHFGYLLVVLIALTYLDTGLVSQSITFYLAAYMVTTLAAFTVVSTVAGEDTAKQDISAFEGLFWHRPLEASALTVAMLSLAGIPLTAGFMAKFFVITVGIQSGLWGLLAALVIGSAVAIYYYLRVIFAMSKSTESTGESASHLEKLLALVLIAAILVLGSWPQPFIAYAGLL
jgi:NADH-quinone oxidoreductase subunit N